MQPVVVRLISLPPMRRLCGCIALLATLVASPAALAVTPRVETTATWVENLNRASGSADWRDAWRLDALAAASTFREWRGGLLTSAELAGGIEHVPEFTDLDAVSAGLGATVRKKFGLGAYAPHVSLEGGIRRREARLELDDSWIATGAIRLAKRLTPAWRVALQGDRELRSARNAIFDTKHHRFFATLTWDITDRLQLSHGNGRLWGSFTANASPAIWSRALAGALGSHLAEYYPTIPWRATDLYGPGWVTYRVDGRVSFYWLELSPALGRNTSLPLRFENRVSVNKVGVKYRQDIWSLSLLHRF